MHWAEPDRSAEVIDRRGIGQAPGTGAAVVGIVDPLGSKALRTTLVHGDAVFEKGGMPEGHAALGGGGLKQNERLALEPGLSDGMLNDEPRGFRAVLPGDVFTRPAVLSDQFPEARGVAHMNRFHTRNIRAAQFPRRFQFAAHTQVFGAQVEELLAKRLVDHSDIDTAGNAFSA